MKIRDTLKNVPYLDITIIWAVVGGAIIAYNQIAMRFFYLESYVLALVPVSIFTILLLIRRKKKFSVKYLRWANYTVTTVFIAVFVVSGSNILWNEATKQINDVSYYNKILRQYGYPKKELRHFPKKIPKEASNVEFYETPQFLQGGAEIRLFYNTSEEEIKKVIDKYRNSSYKVIEDYKGGAGTQLGVWINHYVCENMNEGNTKIFIIDSKPYKPNEGHEWNHGYSYGIAVNEENKKIVYWYERW